MHIVDIRGLKTYYYTREGVVKAVDDISLYLDEGEVLGIVGESGCGKTTLGLTLLRVLPKEAEIIGGTVFIDGVDIVGLDEKDMLSVRGSKISMVFQGAMNSLNPVISIGDQVAEPLIIHGICSKEEARERAREMLSLVGIGGDPFKRYPHELSGGQKQRVAIAMALVTRPRVLVADEPTTALDVIIQRRIIGLLMRLKREMNLTLILISHDFPLVAEISDRIAVMYGGKIVEFGFKNDVVGSPRHPYTLGLINSVPRFGSRRELRGIPGDPISLLNPPRGCRFYDRCPKRVDTCLEYDYTPYKVGGEHIVYCLLYEGSEYGTG